MSSMSEQNPMNPQDPLHYAPRWLRERPESTRLALVEETRDAAPTVEHTDRAVMPAVNHLDSRLETAVFESLRHSLDPHVMREPPDFTRERDRRSVILKIAARFAAATGVAAVVALFFVNIVPVSRQPDASSSFVAAVQSMKTTMPAAASVTAPVAAATADVSEVKAEQTDAKPDKADINPAPALSQFQSLLASGDAAQASTKTEATPDKPLLQQFMQWNQKTVQPDKGQ
jgi:hypothetical protein